MKSDWLTAASFERTHAIVSAINTLSIHAKLTLAGVADPTDAAEIQQARARLLTFLDEFDALLKDTEGNQGGIIVGTDPRLSELALQYLHEKRHLPRRAPLYDLSLRQLGDLIRSEQKDNLPHLVACLQALRSLFEQHGHADAVDVLGDE